MWGRLLTVIVVVVATAPAPAEANGAKVVMRVLQRGWVATSKALTEGTAASGQIVRALTTNDSFGTWIHRSSFSELPLDKKVRLLGELPPDERLRLLSELPLDEGLRLLSELPLDERLRLFNRPSWAWAFDHLELSQPPGRNRRGQVDVSSKVLRELDDSRRIAVIPDGTFRIQGVSVQSGLIIGRQADIDTLLNAGIIRGVMRPGTVPERLRRLPDDRVVIVANPAQAAELFNRLKSPQVQTQVRPYSNGDAAIAATCGFCTPTAAIGYGGGHISFAAGCHNGVKIEVSIAGDFKISLSKGPFSAAVGVEIDTDRQHTAVNDVVVNSPAGVSLSASAGCGGAKIALEVSATAVEWKVTVHPTEAAEANDVSEGIVAPVGTVEADDEDPHETSDSMIRSDRGAIAEHHPANAEPALMVIDAVTKASSPSNQVGGDVGSGVDPILAEWVCAVNADRCWQQDRPGRASAAAPSASMPFVEA